MRLLIALTMGFSLAILEGAETDVSERTDSRRPIWNIGHMVNAIYEIDDFLDEGANSIEIDITFDKNAKAKYTYHGFPCDCHRKCHKKELIENYLNAVRRATTPGDSEYYSQLVLLIFDLKIGMFNGSMAVKAGRDFAKKVLKYYWSYGTNGGSAYLVLSIPDVNHYKFINAFTETLKNTGPLQLLEKVGYDFSGNDDLTAIRKSLERAGVKAKEHIWQSDGITNCVYRDLKRVKKAVKDRDSLNGYINKVYHWTVDEYVSIRDALEVGVDGIITNDPAMVNKVLEHEKYINRFRLANYTDNPFETFAQ